MDDDFNQDKVDYSDIKVKESYIWYVPVGYYWCVTKPCFIMDAGPRSEHVSLVIQNGSI